MPGRCIFGITACARALPDADALRDDMLGAFAELVAVHGLTEDVAPELLSDGDDALQQIEPPKQVDATVAVNNATQNQAA